MKKSSFRLTWPLAGAFLALPLVATPAIAGVYELSVDRVTIDTGEFSKEGIGYNGASPGPVLRFKEGEDVTIHVTNNLDESTSISCHFSKTAFPPSATTASRLGRRSPTSSRSFRQEPTGITATRASKNPTVRTGPSSLNRRRPLRTASTVTTSCSLLTSIPTRGVASCATSR
jgi:hypothetical protein